MLNVQMNQNSICLAKVDGRMKGKDYFDLLSANLLPYSIHAVNGTRIHFHE